MALYAQCQDCNKFVNIAKPLFGSLHLCTLALEYQYMFEAQKKAKPNKFLRSIEKATEAYMGNKDV